MPRKPLAARALVRVRIVRLKLVQRLAVDGTDRDQPGLLAAEAQLGGDAGDTGVRNLGNANHWVQFDLQGTASNRDGIGARVILSAGGVRQLRIADNGSHGRVQHFRRLHFGLGRSSAARQVRVEWPSGAVTEYRDVPAGRIWVLREDGALLPHPAVSQPRPASHSNSERSPAG